MILSKDSNNNWIPTAGGTGTFIGTKAAFDAVKATLPDNTVAYITDDGNELAELKSIAINNKTFTIPTGGFVSWSNLTGLTTQPRLAYVRLTSVSINGADSDCFVEIKSSKYGAHAIFTSVNAGMPLGNGTTLTISGVVYYV